MDFNRQNIFEATSVKKNVVWDAGLRSYMLKVYNYMATGILLTGIISLLSFKMSVVTDSSGAITGFTSFGNAIFFSGLKWLIMLAPLGVIFYMSFGIVFILDTFSLHRCQCCKSFFYYISNIWSNEYLWVHN